jgi:uncharacterized protein (TIGR03437 family)
MIRTLTHAKERFKMLHTNRVTLTCLLLLSAGIGADRAQAQAVTPTLLRLDEANTILYIEDSSFANLATHSAFTPQNSNPAFSQTTTITDIVAANGQAAKGNHFAWIKNLGTSSSLTPGTATADVVRNGMVFHFWEIQQDDGTPIGTIMAMGLGGGSAPPGAPPAQQGANFVITGGTGAFANVRGFGGRTSAPAGATIVPQTGHSNSEDPAYRRVNGGGTGNFLLTLYPAESPAVAITPNGPAVTHSSNFALVSAASPATAGESLSLFATGLGPVKAAINPGQPFPSSPLALVNSPVTVTVNGIAATVTSATGYPGSTDAYQVNFTLPPGLSTGSATLQIASAWFSSAPVSIAIK